MDTKKKKPNLTRVSANQRLNTWAQGHMYPLLKRASGLMVLHMKPAGDSLFNAEWDEQDNFYYYALFCFSLQHHLPQSPPSPPPPPSIT